MSPDGIAFQSVLTGSFSSHDAASGERPGVARGSGFAEHSIGAAIVRYPDLSTEEEVEEAEHPLRFGRYPNDS
ncbi:MAG TPA: hypothetical protein VM328_09870 [Fimbriimonadaceae bacterium]|jgi:hypothetical protein|nr:hypothetical protein [Fimbriimonadaceae bacterium]